MRTVIAAICMALFAIPVSAQEKQATTSSHAVLYGTLIGTGLGLAGGTLFMMGTNCHYGSDSASVMVGCGVVTGGIIAAGVIVGHQVGHRVAKKALQQAPATAQASAWKPPETLPEIHIVLAHPVRTTTPALRQPARYSKM